MKKIVYLLAFLIAAHATYAQKDKKADTKSTKQTSTKGGSSKTADPTKGFTKTQSGLYIKFLKDEKSTPVMKETNIIRVHFQSLTEKDSVLRSTFEGGTPLTMAVPKSTFQGSLEEALGLLSQGDSAAILVNIDSMFIKTYRQPIPDFLKGHKFMKFLLKVERVMTEDEHKKEMMAKAQKQNTEDDKLIQEYIKANAISNAQKTATGLYYVSTKQGTGVQAEKGKKVSVHYTGKLLNGTTFDSSVGRGAPFEFDLGAQNVIAGWDEGIALMKVGEKGLLLIPSSLGYGPQGAGGSIPPNSVLIFEVELMDVK